MGPFSRKKKSGQAPARRSQRRSPEAQFKDGAKLYGVRHGKPDNNRGGTLTDIGEMQATLAGIELVEKGFEHPGLFIASSAARAFQTATIAASQFELMTGKRMRVVSSETLKGLMLHHQYPGQEVDTLARIAAAACNEVHTDIGWVEHFAFFGHEPFLGLQKALNIAAGMNGEPEDAQRETDARKLLQSYEVAYGEIVDINVDLWPRN